MGALRPPSVVFVLGFVSLINSLTSGNIVSSAAPVLLLCLDVRGYCSRRFHVQSFGHVFQVLIKLYDKIKKTV